MQLRQSPVNLYGTPARWPSLPRRAGLARAAVLAVLAGLLLVLGVLAVVVNPWKRDTSPRARRETDAVSAASAASRPATNPTALPGPKQSSSSEPTPADYMAIVREALPGFPTTQPLAIPLDNLGDAARVVLRRPVLLDQAGDLWISHPDAPSAAQVARDWNDGREQVHLTRDRVVFAYRTWNEKGRAEPQIIIRRPDGQHVLVNPLGLMEIGEAGRDYRWDRATWVKRTVDEMLVVPTGSGVSIIRPTARPLELYQDLRNSPHGRHAATSSHAPAATRAITDEPPTTPEPQFLLDTRGLIAWLPWDDGQSGGRGAARFVDGTWKPLTPESTPAWPYRIVHVVPLLDGSALILSRDDAGTASVQLAVLDVPATTSDSADSTEVAALVQKLSDPDVKTRDAAHSELTRFGPGAFAQLERQLDQQPAEARLRMEQILASKTRPTLGRMQLVDGPLRVVARFGDGGALLYAEAGVSIPSETEIDDARSVAPAWIAIRPGQPIELASPFLVADLDPGKSRLSGFSGEWIVSDEVMGPQRFLGNHLEPLLRKGERDYGKVIGTDRRGRWLFRKAGGDDGSTLIVDPTLPDPSPRLPVWRYPVENGSVGWTLEGWPVVKSGGAWVIGKDGTRPMRDKDEMMFTDMREMPTVDTATAEPSATAPTATAPATHEPASTTQPDEPLEEPLLVDSAGGRYFDGRSTLRYIGRDGTDITWQLPAEGVGSTTPHLIEAEDRLFLFNEPGRVLRLRRTKPATTATSTGVEPFVLEATFVKNIPHVAEPSRVWLDPAGRICMAADGNRLVILFPSGRIPPPIARIMVAEDLKANEPD